MLRQGTLPEEAVKLNGQESLPKMRKREPNCAGRLYKYDDDGVLQVIAAQAKRRIEAAEAFDSGGRDEKAAAERAELEVLEEFLPKGLDAGELEALVDRVLADGGLSEKAQMGQAMKAVNAEVAGRADGRAVADLVKSKLS